MLGMLQRGTKSLMKMNFHTVHTARNQHRLTPSQIAGRCRKASIFSRDTKCKRRPHFYQLGNGKKWRPPNLMVSKDFWGHLCPQLRLHKPCPRCHKAPGLGSHWGCGIQGHGKMSSGRKQVEFQAKLWVLPKNFIGTLQVLGKTHSPVPGWSHTGLLQKTEQPKHNSLIVGWSKSHAVLSCKSDIKEWRDTHNRWKAGQQEHQTYEEFAHQGQLSQIEHVLHRESPTTIKLHRAWYVVSSHAHCLGANNYILIYLSISSCSLVLELVLPACMFAFPCCCFCHGHAPYGTIAFRIKPAMPWGKHYCWPPGTREKSAPKAKMPRIAVPFPRNRNKNIWQP